MARLDDVQFTVDTALFRQLGELLVGRDATALIELVKNAYDADATTVVLGGFELASPERGFIKIIDNGVGMTGTQFKNGFLRLAARGKGDGARRTPVYQRHFTGEKGVGRLAAHKLGALLSVKSVAVVHEGEPAAQAFRSSHPDAAALDIQRMLAEERATIVDALIDWNLIEEAESLSTVERGLEAEIRPVRRGESMGTEIQISDLRHSWDDRDLQELSRQLRNFSPPLSLAHELPKATLASPLLFADARVRDAHRADPGMKLELEGEFASPEEYWTQVERSADWVLEIRATRGKPIDIAASPTRSGLVDNPHATAVAIKLDHPAPDLGPFFDARVFLRSGTVPPNERAWSQMNSGIRVYLEGFRVLPYGEVGNDWLSLDQDYTRRSGRIDINPLAAGPEDSIAELRALSARDVNLRLQPNRNFYGAVFLTDADSGGLRTLVNREGFVPDDAYDRLVAILRSGTNLAHRAWALASLALKRQRAAEARLRREEALAALSGDLNAASSDEEEPSAEDDTNEWAHLGEHETNHRSEPNSAQNDVENSEEDLPILGADRGAQGSASKLKAELARFGEDLRELSGRPCIEPPEADRIQLLLKSVDAAADRLIEDASLLRVLASIGSQLAIATHELSNLAPLARDAEMALSPVPGERWPGRAVSAREAVAELRRAIERQASFLTDTSTNEARRRRTRLNLFERVEVVLITFRSTAARTSTALVNGVSKDIRTPPLFRSELQAMLSNLISNALKATDVGGRVGVFASEADEALSIRVENTGTAMDVSTSEKWFAPFASTSPESDPVLGQGMGLGLPITRDFVEEYGGRVRFVPPSSDYATAVEIVLPR